MQAPTVLSPGLYGFVQAGDVTDDKASARCHSPARFAAKCGPITHRVRDPEMTNLTTRLMTLLTGTLVGRDEQGNAYYRGKKPAANGRERRWVVYRGEVEASRIPPHWHAWLHRLVDEPPVNPPPAHPWQEAHQPNLTGTPVAYRPAGSTARGGHRAATTSDYEPWVPD